MTNPLGKRQSAAWLANLTTGASGQGEGAMPWSEAQVNSLSPLALAYIGDAVYELFVRNCYLFPPQRLHTYHQQVVEQVRAERQAAYLEVLQPQLTEFEQDIVRRGRNAATRRSQRANLQDYQRATGLEALIGYLYLTDSQRLLEVLASLPLPDASPPAP